MRGVHDVGGREGFGAVPIDEDDAVPFEHDWEARIYGIYRVLASKGVINPHEMRAAVEEIAPERYLAASYYERWIDAIEVLATQKGLIDGP